MDGGLRTLKTRNRIQSLRTGRAGCATERDGVRSQIENLREITLERADGRIGIEWRIQTMDGKRPVWLTVEKDVTLRGQRVRYCLDDAYCTIVSRKGGVSHSRHSSAGKVTRFGSALGTREHLPALRFHECIHARDGIRPKHQLESAVAARAKLARRQTGPGSRDVRPISYSATSHHQCQHQSESNTAHYLTASPSCWGCLARAGRSGRRRPRLWRGP